jgi:hypothetical protein
MNVIFPSDVQILWKIASFQRNVQTGVGMNNSAIIARRFRVVRLALRLFSVILLPVQVNGRIAGQIHQLFPPRTLILSSPFADAAGFNLI